MDKQQALKILMLNTPYTMEELKTSYRLMVKKNHPDIKKDGEKAFKAIKEAYEFLKAQQVQDMNVLEESYTHESILSIKIRRN